ncbi:hypothetical protein RP20_CCG019544 [Aedes albopictus]|nr:hypothetical protein RP20_CCG019544 [Aedes albopictus]
MEHSCRICCKTAPFEPVWLSAWSENRTEIISDMFTYCTQLEVSYSDLLPQQICRDCLSSLMMAYNFRKLCRHSDASFREELRNRKFANHLVETNSFCSQQFDNDWNKECVNQSIVCAVPTESSSKHFSEPILEPVDSQALAFHCCFKQCNERTKDFGELKEHAIRHHESHRNDNELSRHSDQFICPICKRGFSNATQWTLHQDFIQGIRGLYSCTKCDQSFGSDEELSNHMAAGCHIKKKVPSNIENVPKDSSLRQSLIRRILAVKRTEELVRISPEECAIVKDKYFFNRLHRNELKHSRKQVKLYLVCNTCIFRAASAKIMRSHLNSGSCAQGYYYALGFCPVISRKIQCLECVTCGYQAIYGIKLRRHQEIHNHHGIRRAVKVHQVIERTFPCELCGKVLKSTTIRKRHRSKCLLTTKQNTTQIIPEASKHTTETASLELKCDLLNTCNDGQMESFITDIKIEEIDPDDVMKPAIDCHESETQSISASSSAQPEPVNRDQSKSSVICVICGYTTRKRGNLKRHLKACIERVPAHQSAYFGEIVKQELAISYRRSSPRVCNNCGYSTKKSGNMKRHLARCFSHEFNEEFVQLDDNSSQLE